MGPRDRRHSRIVGSLKTPLMNFSNGPASSNAHMLAGLLERHLDNSPLAVIEWDGQFRVRRWSGRATAMFGWRSDEVAGLHPDDWRFIVEEDGVRTRDVMAALLQGKVDHNISRNRNFHRDGHVIHCEWYNSVLRDADGNLLSILSLASDITLQQEQAEHLQLLTTIIENTSDGVMMTDAQGRILTVNRAFTEVTGYREEEARGNNPRMLQSGVHDQQFYARMWGALKQQGRWQGEIWNRRKSGEIYPQWIRTNAVHDADGQLRRYVSVFSDLTDIRRSEAELEKLAHQDPVTELPNRLLFRSRLEQALRQRRSDQDGPAVVHVDINDFRAVNDSYGHQAGDRILYQLGRRLKPLIWPSETLACLGGDEFALLCSSRERAVVVAERMLELFAQPLQTLQAVSEPLFLTLAIGIAVAPTAGQSVDELLQHAYGAANSAKQDGGNSYRFYTQHLTARARRRLFLINGLRNALNRGELALHYQPQVDTISQRVTGLEALLRWHHPEDGPVSPAEFIPLAEETGLIVPIGNWVLEQACKDMAALKTRNIAFGHMAVNLSALQLQQAELPIEVQLLLDRHSLSPGELELEVTETSVMEPAARHLLDSLRELGVTLALDDFGTGYSSLAYLQQLPFDLIKVDRTFVQRAQHATRDHQLLSGIVQLIHGLDRSALLEGIETPEQLQIARALHCERVQGFLFSRPLPLDQVMSLLGDGQRYPP